MGRPAIGRNSADPQRSIRASSGGARIRRLVAWRSGGCHGVTVCVHAEWHSSLLVALARADRCASQLCGPSQILLADFMFKNKGVKENVWDKATFCRRSQAGRLIYHPTLRQGREEPESRVFWYLLDTDTLNYAPSQQ